MSNSEKFKLNKEDGFKLLKGLGIALGGTALAYVTEMLPMIDFNGYNNVAMVVGMLVINTIRKLLIGKK